MGVGKCFAFRPEKENGIKKVASVNAGTRSRGGKTLSSMARPYSEALNKTDF